MKRLLSLSFAILATGPWAIAAGADSGAQPKIDLSVGHTLYTVGYAHLDTQWRWAYPTTLNEYIPNTMNDNFRLLDKYPHYIFNFSGANRYRMMKEYYPADYEKVKQYVARGRWFPCGSSMEECDVNTTSAESIIRQTLYGNHFFRKELGRASSEFMLPDCFGFPASLPGLLVHCGIKGFSTQKLGWGSAVGIPFNVGVWEGPDGSSLIAALNPDTYVSKIGEDLSRSEAWFKRVDQNGRNCGLFADYRYYGTGDIGGAPSEDSVKWIEASVAGNGPLRIVSATAERMFLDITPDQVRKLPRYRGDMLLTQHSAGSITSQAYMKRWNRMNELLADSAEKASIAASRLGGVAYPKEKLNNAWTLVMGGQFHDILPGTSLPTAYEYSWNDEVLAMNQFASVLDESVGAVASSLDTRAKGEAVLVYNPLSIAREDIVEAAVAFQGTAPSHLKVVGPDGTEMPSQVTGHSDGITRVAFLANVPSVGYAVYDVQKAESPAKLTGALSVTQSSLENRRYRVTLGASGDVAGIYDKLAKRELLSAPIRLAFTHDAPREWPAWNIDWDDQSKPPNAYVDGPAKVRIVEAGPVRVALAIEREAQGSKFIQIIRLAAGGAGDRVEFVNTIDWRSSQSHLKAVFPLTVSNPMATYNWELGTVERGNNDPKKYEAPSHQWFDLTDSKGDYGVTVLSPFKYGSDKPDDNTLRLTLLRTPGANGKEYTDQATQDWGRHEISYGIAGHKSDWREGQTDWQAMRMEQPLLAFQCAKHDGKLGRTLSMVKTSSSRVRVMALKNAEDSDEIIIRLVEMNGKPANDVRVSFAAPIVSAREVNGQEQPVGGAKIISGRLLADLAGYGLRSFAIKLAASSVRLNAAQAQPIALPFNACVSTSDGEKSVGGFDFDGRCIAAEMLPAQVVDGGIVFKLSSPAKGQPNAVKCDGQELKLPEGKYGAVAFLAASSSGDQNAVFEVDGRKVTRTIQDWGGFIGQWDTRIWKGKARAVAFEWPNDYAGLRQGFIKRDPVAWFCSHRHTSDGKNDPYSYSYLYRYTIEVPSGARTIKLPRNNSICILAASMLPVTSRCKPAQPLYDDL